MSRDSETMPDLDLLSLQQSIAATRFSGHLHHFASVTSTNQLALEAAQSGARVGVWLADEQTAGRGRGNHDWHSAPGDGLYVSILVAPRIPLAIARNLPLAAGLAVQAAVLEVTGLKLDLRWPNDLMFGDRKCGGILVESASEPTAPDAPSGPNLRYAVIGIGLNLNHAAFPAELASVATSLYLESERHFAREPLLAALLGFIDHEVVQLEQKSSVTELFDRFKASSTWVSGKRVRVEEAGGYTGWTCGLNKEGFLQVRDENGAVHTVFSGGVRSA